MAFDALTRTDKEWLAELAALTVAAVVQSNIAQFTSQEQEHRCADIREFGRTDKTIYSRNPKFLRRYKP